MPGGRLNSLVLDLLYPPRCPVCHGIAPGAGKICPECEALLPRIETARCRKCGKPVGRGESLCPDCRAYPHVYTQGLGLFRYDDLMRETISYFKYKGRREYGAALGRLLYEGSRDLLALWKPGCVIPVPADPGRTAARGYNHAEELARPLAELAGLPLLTGALVRTGRTEAMKALGVKERRNNLIGVFRPAPGITLPERALLVDDIYTTGSTIDACAYALKQSGVRRVFFLTLCIGGGGRARY